MFKPLLGGRHTFVMLRIKTGSPGERQALFSEAAENVRTVVSSILDNTSPCGELLQLWCMITFHLIYPRCNSRLFSCSSVSTEIKLCNYSCLNTSHLSQLNCADLR